MIRKHLLTIVVTVLLLSLLCVTGWAEDSEVSRATLAGIQGLSVVVEEVQPNVQKYAAKFGLSGAQIRRDVEQKLRENGIRVVEGNDWLAIPGRREKVCELKRRPYSVKICRGRNRLRA